jgi:hypothetical protein
MVFSVSAAFGLAIEPALLAAMVRKLAVDHHRRKSQAKEAV